MKHGPLAFIVEVVHHQEAAALEVFSEARRLRVGEDPVAHAHRIEKWPVEDLVAIDIDNFLDRARVDARQAANGLHEEALGFVGIGAPAGKAAEVAVARRTETQAGESELGLLPGVRRVVDRVLHLALVLRPAVLAEAVLGGDDSD